MSMDQAWSKLRPAIACRRNGSCLRAGANHYQWEKVSLRVPTMRNMQKNASGCLLGLTLIAAACALPFSSAGASGAKKFSIAYLHLHPCALITQSQVAAAVGASMGAAQSSPNKFSGSCNYTSTSTTGVPVSVGYEFVPGSVASNEAQGAFQKPIIKEKSVGHDAVCSGGQAVFLSVVGGNNAYNLSLAVPSCAVGVALAKDAIAHLS